jgi:hypothetical protein
MSCKVHDWRAIDKGIPPKEDAPAWCRTCGALRCQSPFGGLGVQHPLSDREAPTLLNKMSEALRRRRETNARCDSCGDPVHCSSCAADQKKREDA